MKKLIHIVAIAIAAAWTLSLAAQTAPADPNLLVTMPSPPDRLTTLSQRCNYIIDNYWKTFNPKSSFSSQERLNHTLGTFFGFVPYATADTVFMSIDHLLQQVAKAKPQNLLDLARMAEGWTYSDTAEVRSDELYFPFVEAVALNKKVKGAEKERFVYQYRQLLGSRLSQPAPDFEMTLRDGSRKKFSEVTPRHVILLFYDPDCDDCRAAKTRLDADFTISTLIKRRQAAVVAVYTGDDPNWAEASKDLPETWVVGHAPEAETLYTMTAQPEIYYILGDTREIQAKDLSATELIEAFRQTFTRRTQKQQEQQAE
ncbi:MAG: DUF5106 domain-containing protein [Muribaculaceae bacterium]